MRTALDASPADLDPDEGEFVAAIREQGWFRTEVLADEDGPGFSYTTGFWLAAGFPEIILFSLRGETAHAVLESILQDLRAGTPPPVGVPAPGIIGGAEAALIPVAPPRYRDYLGWSRWFYRGDDFACLQLVWPDRDGHFPWQREFDPSFADLQPDLSAEGWARIMSER